MGQAFHGVVIERAVRSGDQLRTRIQHLLFSRTAPINSAHTTQVLLSIQFLRFVAALMVVIHHCIDYMVLHVGPVPDGIQEFTNIGAAGVHIFFVISGFIIVWSAHHQFGKSGQTFRFLKRRIARIYPLYWGCALLSFAFILLLNFKPLMSIIELFSSLMLWPAQSSWLLPVGWTLPYELFFYFSFAFVLSLPRGRALMVLSAAFLCLMLCGFLIPIENSLYEVATNLILFEFLAGALFAHIVLNGVILRKEVSLLCVGVGVVGILTSFLHVDHLTPRILAWGAPSLLLIFGLVSVERLGFLPGFVTKFAFLGDSSYSLYLVHAALLAPASLFVASIYNGDSEWSLVAIALIMTGCFIYVSHLNYLWIEKKLNAGARRLLSN